MELQEFLALILYFVNFIFLLDTLDIDTIVIYMLLSGTSQGQFFSLSGSQWSDVITTHSNQTKLDLDLSRKQRRRIYTERKAKVVAAVWGTEFI